MAQTKTKRVGAPWRPADTFGTRLLLIRRELGLTTEEAATRCGLAGPTWNTWENGVTPRNLAAVVSKIHAGLGVDRDYLMWGSSSGYRSDSPGLGVIGDTLPLDSDDLPLRPVLAVV